VATSVIFQQSEVLVWDVAEISVGRGAKLTVCLLDLGCRPLRSGPVESLANFPSVIARHRTPKKDTNPTFFDNVVESSDGLLDWN